MTSVGRESWFLRPQAVVTRRLRQRISCRNICGYRPYMSSHEDSNPLKHLEEALQGGRVQAASNELRELIGLAADLGALGKDVGKILLALYDDFEIRAMCDFADLLQRHPAEEVARPALEAVESLLSGIEDWQRIFRELAGERLARDLMQQVRSRDVSAATDTARNILVRASSPESRMRLSRQVGAILGSMPHDQDRAEQVVNALSRDLESVGIDETHLAVLEEMWRTSLTNLGRTEPGVSERQWNRIHTDAVVQLMRALPGRTVGPQPTAEQEQHFYDALHLMVAAYYADEAVIDFLDIARILREFCPTDPRPTGPVEGVEAVAFVRMNPGDKLASVRGLRRLGQKEKLVESVLRAVKSYREGRPADILMAVMGGLSNNRFFPYLSSALRDKRFSRMVPLIIDSLGRIGNARCLGALQNLLEHYCGSRLIDPPTRRLIGYCLASLGRIARHPTTSNDQRNAIALKALKTLPDDGPIGQAALHHFFTMRDAGTLSDEVKGIGMRLIVGGLWSQSSRSKLAKGDERQRTELGFREELVDILVNMGPRCLALLLKEAERRSMQYSGAYWAVGEALGKIGDERALPFIEKILINTFVTDDSALPKHMRESYFDAARNEYVPLTRDRVAHSLLYAVRERCGQAGRRFLIEIGKAFQSHVYTAPGPQSAALVQQILVEEHLREEALRREEAPLREDAAAPQEDIDALLQPEAKRPREDDSLDRLIKDIRGKRLFRVKTAKRVAAIQEAAARRAQEAVGPLCEQLDDEDRAVRAAAGTALQEILRSPTAPSNTMIFELLESLRKAPPARVDAITSIAAKLHPQRDPLKTILLRFVETESDEKQKKRIAGIFRVAHEQEAAAARRAAEAAPPEERLEVLAPDTEEDQPEREMPGVQPHGRAAPTKESVLPLPPGAQTRSPQEIFELRRRYFAERQVWLAGNKRGPEPKRPAGV